MQESRFAEDSFSTTRILLVEDHAVVRRYLRSLIEKEPEFKVIGEAEDGRIAVDLVRELLPDVVITDVSMPNLNGVDATRLILRKFTQVRVVALSSYSDRLHVAGMLKAGASACDLKDCASTSLLKQ